MVGGGRARRFSMALAFLSTASASRANRMPDSPASASPRRSSARLRRNSGSTLAAAVAPASDRKVSPARRGAVQATRAALAEALADKSHDFAGGDGLVEPELGAARGDIEEDAVEAAP